MSYINLAAWECGTAILAYDADWQLPARTEQYAFEQLAKRGIASPSCAFVAFPWASLIDGLARGTVLGERLTKALDKLKKPVGKKRIVTVCQHIKFRDYLHLFEKAGITDLFASHAEVSERRIGKINIHPFPLYPAQAEKDSLVAQQGTAEFLARPHLFSFVGAYDSRYYLTPVRRWISNLRGAENGYIELREQWHFEKRVYANQVYGEALTETERAEESTAAADFVSLLKDTQFSLCPSGTGPNSIRLWESLEFGCIPVILSDKLALPGPEDLWRRACVFIDESEASVLAIPNRLAELARDPVLIANKLSACADLRSKFGLVGFATGIEALFRYQTHIAENRREIDFHLSTEQLSAASVAAWRTFLETAARTVGRSCRVICENQNECLRAESSCVDGHDWVNEDIVFLSDARTLSARLLRRFNRFLISPNEASLQLNVDLAVVDMFQNGDTKSGLSVSNFWHPICSLITSVFDGDEYIEDFMDNSSQLNAYAEIEHFIVLANSPGRELEKLRRHAAHSPGVVLVWLANDPGLYGVWNQFSCLATGRYISNANIDDKRAPSHVQELTKLLDRERDCDVASAGLRITKDSKTTWETSDGLDEWYASGEIARKGFGDLFKATAGNIRAHNFPHCMPIWRSSLMAANGEFEERRFGPSSDWEYWLRAARRGARFIQSGQALGLYYIAPESYWRRNPDAAAFERAIHREYFEAETRSASPQDELVSLRVSKIVSNQEQGQHLEALVQTLRLVADLQMGRLFKGKKALALIAMIASRYGINAPTDLVFGHDWKKLSPSDELEASIAIIIGVMHAAKTVPSCVRDTWSDVGRDYYVRTGDLRGILMVAFLSRKLGQRELEVRLLRWARCLDPMKFFQALSGAYRFCEPLSRTLSIFPELPSGQEGPFLPEAKRVFVFPDYAAGNPYQKLLYKSVKDRNVDVIRIDENDYETLFGSESITERGDLVHIHWLNSLFKDVAPEDYSAVEARFLADVARLRNRGVLVHWTVHNLYNHDVYDRERERLFRNQLSRSVDRVYIHHPVLLPELGEWLDSSGNVTVLEHGNFLDVYPSKVGREAARQRLGLLRNDFVLAVVGQIREYKDFAKYVPAIVEAMKRDTRLKLLVAGKISCAKAEAALQSVPSDRLIVINKFVADDEFDLYISSASAVLLTYRHILTSGSLFQALGFGCPVLAPDMGSIPSYVVDYYNGFIYSPENFADKLAHLLNTREIFLDQMARNAKTTADQLAWPS